MRSVAWGTGGPLPDFEVPVDHPYYWLLRLCHQEVAMAEDMRDKGFEVIQIDGNELYAAEGRFDGFAAYLSGWLQGAVAASQAGTAITPFDYNAIPDLIELLYICVTGNWGLVFVLFVKVGLKFLLSWLERRLPKDTDLSEAAQMVDKIFLDKTDPEDVRNRIEDLCYLLQSATAAVNINFGNEVVASTGEILEQ